MEWFLVISLYGSDELLLKKMSSKEECVKVQQQFSIKARKKIKMIEDVTCEEGTIIQQYDIKEQKDEVL